MVKTMKPLNFGRRKEQRVAQALRNRGAKVSVSEGSRGAADLKAKFPSGTKWNVQVKSTRAGSPSSPTARDLGRLKQGAARNGATPVVAKVFPQKIEYKSASGKKLVPPKRRK